MVLDTSGITYILPIIAFLLVVVLVYAVLLKLKISEKPWAAILIALFIGVMFITVAGSIEYVRYISGWMAMLFVSIIFILGVFGLFGKGLEGSMKGFGIAFLVVAILIFVISGLVVYGSYINHLLPGGADVGSESPMGGFTGWLYSSKVIGAVVLLVVGALAAWILSKAK